MLRLLVLTSVGLTLFAAVVGYQPRVEPARSRAAEALAVRAPTPAAVGLPRDGLLLGPGELAQPGAIRTLPGQTGSAAPLNVRTRDVDLSARIQTDRLADGGDQYAYLVLRSVNAASYLGRVRLDTSHGAWLQVARRVGPQSELLGAEAAVPNYSHTPEAALRVRAVAAGDSPTQLLMKAWRDGNAEPPGWQYVVSDSHADLRSAGAVALETYVSARATNAPVTFVFSDLRVVAPAPELLLTLSATVPSPTAVSVVRIEPTPLPPTPRPTVAPTPRPPTSTEIWAELGPELDNAWHLETRRSIDLLHDFLGRFPEHELAREKLYAALMAGADDLLQKDSVREAAELLTEARGLLPDRGEATVALIRLTPTAVPQPIAPAVSPPRAAPTPVIRVVVPPPPVRPPTPRPAPPAVIVAAGPTATPTKVPFNVPLGGRP